MPFSIDVISNAVYVQTQRQKRSPWSFDDLFYLFLLLVSVSLRSWNADDREDVGSDLLDGIYVLLLCLGVLWIRPFSTKTSS